MKKIDLGKIQPFHFGDKLLIAVSDKYTKLNNGKSLVFDCKIDEKNQLVLSATLATEDDKTTIPGETDERT